MPGPQGRCPALHSAAVGQDPRRRWNKGGRSPLSLNSQSPQSTAAGKWGAGEGSVGAPSPAVQSGKPGLREGSIMVHDQGRRGNEQAGNGALTRAPHQRASDPRKPDQPQAQGGQPKAWETLPVAERLEVTRPLCQSSLDLSKAPSIFSERAEDTRRARPSAQVSEMEELPAPRTEALAEAQGNTGRASKPERVRSAGARGPGARPLLGAPEASEGKDSPKWTDYAPSASNLRKHLRLCDPTRTGDAEAWRSTAPKHQRQTPLPRSPVNPESPSLPKCSPAAGPFLPGCHTLCPKNLLKEREEEVYATLFWNNFLRPGSPGSLGSRAGKPNLTESAGWPPD